MFRVFANALIVVTIFFCAGTLFANPAKEKLRSYIQARNTAMLNRALRDSIGHTVTAEEVGRVALEERYHPLKRALKAAYAIRGLDLNLDMSMAELVQITYFIQVQLQPFIHAKKYYLSTKDSGLSRAIEYDPLTELIFIHLDMKNSSCLGIGAKKRVTKSILYDPDHPEVLARLDQHSKCEREMEISKKLKGVDGVLQVKAYTERQEDGVTYHTMFCKLYRQGTIFQVLKNAEYRFSLKEKLGIALSIVKGLEGMQKRNIVHKDLHHHNYLVNITKNKKGSRQGSRHGRNIEVVIADLGLANYIWKSRRGRPQGDTNYAPPESFVKRLAGKDFYNTDLFAVGCLLYQIYYEKMPHWQEVDYPKRANSLKLCARRLHQLIEKSTAARRIELAAKRGRGRGRGAKLTPKEEFESIILHMVNPDFKKRPKAKEVRKKLEQVMKRLPHTS